MNTKRKITSGLAALAVGVGLALSAPLAANATGNPDKLDRGDLTLACRIQHGAIGWVANLRGGNAYSWRCEYPAGGRPSTGVDVNNYCMNIWGWRAVAKNSNDPYSWSCRP